MPEPKPTARAAGPSAEALAAFYAQRSAALRRNTTVAGDGAAAPVVAQPAQPVRKPTTGVVDYVISALQGHPGYLNP